METKVKEEIIDKEYQPASERRQSSASGPEQHSPEAEDREASPAGGPAAGPGSPALNGAALSSTESLSPPLPDGARSSAALQRLRRFLSALHQFAGDVPGDAGDRVRMLIHNLVAGSLSIEEFQCGVQEASNYPLRASVPRFLRALLPLARQSLAARAHKARQTPLQYIRSHEHLVLDAGDARDDPPPPQAGKRFYELSNGGGEDEGPAAKRAGGGGLLAAPFLYALPSNASLFDASHTLPYPPEHMFDRRDAVGAAGLGGGMGGGGERRGEDEWRNIHTMLNCILSMVEKTKRALAILQHRGVDPSLSTGGGAGGACSGAGGGAGGAAAGEALAAALRHAEERVAELRRRAEDAVLQVKRQALCELQRAVLAAEQRARELLAPAAAAPAPPAPAAPAAPPAAPAPLAPHDIDLSPQQNCCWNCGRAAHETCSGCGAARYCGAFCQHKDWTAHHQVCSGREQKPSSLRTSPPAPSTGRPVRAATPLTSTPVLPQLSLSALTAPADRLPLTSPADRLTLTAAPDRLTLTAATDRHTLAGLGTQPATNALAAKK